MVQAKKVGKEGQYCKYCCERACTIIPCLNLNTHNATYLIVARWQTEQTLWEHPDTLYHIRERRVLSNDSDVDLLFSLRIGSIRKPTTRLQGMRLTEWTLHYDRPLRVYLEAVTRYRILKMR